MTQWLRNSQGKRRVLIHAGLHKTGTTAIQYFLTEASEALREQGILYPISGRPAEYPLGHHNLAWELAGDRRFRASYGTLEDVASEIAAFPGDAILSSEDFESVLGSASRLSRLTDHRLLRGHVFTMVFWIRDQASYVESLFFQMLFYCMGEEAARVCESAISCGQVRHQDWTFQFDYQAATACLLSLPIKVAVRPYNRLTGGSSVTDFLAYTGLSGSINKGIDRRVNGRADLAEALAAFYENRAGIKFEWHGALRAGIRQSLGGREARLSSQMRSALAARFLAGNNSLAAACSFPQETLAISSMLEGAIPLEALFSLQTQRLLCDLVDREADANQVSITLQRHCLPA